MIKTLMERVHAVQAAEENDTPFLHATNMEAPLATIRNLASALCTLAETMEDPHEMIVWELAFTIKNSLDLLDEEHTYFFRLHHPCPPAVFPEESGDNSKTN